MNPEKFVPQEAMEGSGEREEKKEFGSGVHLEVVFARHGKKEKSGLLTEEGAEQARNLGLSLEIPKDGIKAYHSETKRTEQTVKEALSMIDEDSKVFKTRRKTNLLDPSVFCKGYDEYHKLLKEKGQDAATGYILSWGEKKPISEEYITYSPKEMASLVSQRLENFLEMSKRLYSNSDVKMLNGSHTGPLEAFLMYAAGKKIEEDPINPNGETFIEKMGGSFKSPEDSFYFDIKRENKDKVEVILHLRNKTYEINSDEIKELADYERKLEK